MRPGLSGLSKMQLVYGNDFGGNGPPGGSADSFPCPASSAWPIRVIQEVGALPSGTSAPNTVITEHAIRQLGSARQHVRLADPDPAPAHRRADHQRPADRGRGRA